MVSFDRIAYVFVLAPLIGWSCGGLDSDPLGSSDSLEPFEQLAADEAPAEQAPAQAEPLPEPEAEPEPTPAARTYDPYEVTYDAYPVFGPALDTSDELWAELQALAETMADPDAGVRQARATRALELHGFRALPAILNRMRELDLGSPEGHLVGDLMQRSMTTIMNGINAGWEYETDAQGRLTNRAHRYNRKVVVVLLRTWGQIVEDPTRWIAVAKLSQEKYADQLVEYSAALHAAGITEGDYFDHVLPQ